MGRWIDDYKYIFYEIPSIDSLCVINTKLSSTHIMETTTFVPMNDVWTYVMNAWLPKLNTTIQCNSF